MAKPSHLEYLANGRDFWNRWRSKNPDIKPDLSGAQLAGENLSDFNFREANLQDSDLSGANLSNSQFQQASLRNARITEANLSKADLTGAYLHAANLDRANLSHAILSKSYLHQALLREANLSEADLTKANLSMADLSQALLVRATFTRGNLRQVRLNGANLSRAYLSNCDLTQGKLSRANMTRANLYQARLNGAELFEANLPETVFYQADLRNADLSGATLTRANLTGANLSEAMLIGTDLSDANLSQANIAGVSALEVKLNGTRQENLIISTEHKPMLSCDDFNTASLLYSLLYGPENLKNLAPRLNNCALFLGSFSADRAILTQKVKAELQANQFQPIYCQLQEDSTPECEQRLQLLIELARVVILDLGGINNYQEALPDLVKKNQQAHVFPIILAPEMDELPSEFLLNLGPAQKLKVLNAPEELCLAEWLKEEETESVQKNEISQPGESPETEVYSGEEIEQSTVPDTTTGKKNPKEKQTVPTAESIKSEDEGSVPHLKESREETGEASIEPDPESNTGPGAEQGVEKDIADLPKEPPATPAEYPEHPQPTERKSGEETSPVAPDEVESNPLPGAPGAEAKGRPTAQEPETPAEHREIDPAPDAKESGMEEKPPLPPTPSSGSSGKEPHVVIVGELDPPPPSEEESKPFSFASMFIRVAIFVGVLGILLIGYWLWGMLHRPLLVTVHTPGRAYAFLDNQPLLPMQIDQQSSILKLPSVRVGSHQLTVYTSQLEDISATEFVRFKVYRKTITIDRGETAFKQEVYPETLYVVRKIGPGILPGIDPSGTKICYIRPGDDWPLQPRDRELRIYDRDTGQDTAVALRPAYLASRTWGMPVFDDSGKTIFMAIQRRGQSAIYQIDWRSGAATRTRVPITSAKERIFCSGDSNRLVIFPYLYSRDGRQTELTAAQNAYQKKVFSGGSEGILFFELEKKPGSRIRQLRCFYSPVNAPEQKMERFTVLNNRLPHLNGSAEGTRIVLTEYSGLSREFYSTIALWQDSILTELTPPFLEGIDEQGHPSNYPRIEAYTDARGQCIVFSYRGEIYLIEFAGSPKTSELQASILPRY